MESMIDEKNEVQSQDDVPCKWRGYYDYVNSVANTYKTSVSGTFDGYKKSVYGTFDGYKSDIDNKKNIVGEVLSNLIVTKSSDCKHGFLNKYRAFMAPTRNPTKLSNKNVIMFVHGRNGSPTDVIPLIENLEKRFSCMPNDELEEYDYAPDDVVLKLSDSNYYVIRVVDQGDTKYTDIDDDCMMLNSEMENYENCNIYFVGFSKGGLVAMRYVTTCNYGTNIIKMVITVSSPLHGTKIANLFPKSSVVHESLGFNSEICQHINVDRKNLSDIKICHVVPKYDVAILPTSSAMYDDIDPNNIYHYDGDEYGHLGIMYCEKVAENIEVWITCDV